MTRQQRLALFATIIGSGMVFLDGSVVNLALPKIAGDLHASFTDLQWIVDGYLLSLSALILLGGSLGDIFGRKKMYLFGLVGFSAVSLLCGLSPDPTTLIILRILQGVFGALLVPGGLAIINTNFSLKDRGAAIGTWSAWTAVFAAMGPLVGGYLLDVASWRWIFFINIPLGIACYVCGSLGVQESRDTSPRRVDITGAVLATVALAGLTYGLIEGPAHHWDATALVPLIISVIFSIAFVRLEAHHKDPMVKLSLFKSRNFTGSNLMTFMMYGALAGFFFALVIYLQTRLHYSAIKAGVSLLPTTIFLVLFSKRVGKLSSQYGPRFFMTVGPIIAGIGILSLINLHNPASYFGSVLPGVVLFSIGVTLFVAPLTTTVMTSVSDINSGIASGINNAVSRVAGLVVIALLGLYGSGEFFKFSIWLCSLMAIAGGLLAFVLIKNPKPLKTKKTTEA